METDTTLALLQAALETAVPLWQMELRQRSFALIVARAQELAQVIAEKGDVIMFRSKKGKSAKAFNALAEGVAALSFAPGGVRIFGLHFEQAHPECAQYGAPFTPTMIELTSAILATVDRVRIEE